ncbi:MAG: DUF309 domain-containing protein [Anaerolineae bacterium]|nr:DUF309 domain-containing protein [Anaerolineae bacterium]
MVNQPVIAVTGKITDLIQAAVADTHTLTHYTDRVGYIAHLTEDHTELLLVDGAADDWRFWTTTPKTSPATRRIPVILIGDAPGLGEAGLMAGADLVISPADFISQLLILLKHYARLPDPAQVEQMACDCQADLPDLAQQGVEKFNQREFYAQHDLFEALWMQTESPVRDLYRAILQVGIAYYQILRGNPRGAKKMLLRSVQWLAILPDECQGIDIAQLKADSYRVRAELGHLGDDHIREFDLTLLKPLRRTR